MEGHISKFPNIAKSKLKSAPKINEEKINEEMKQEVLIRSLSNGTVRVRELEIDHPDGENQMHVCWAHTWKID